MPPLGIAGIAGLLIFAFAARLLLALFDVPRWTTSWQVVEVLTWPLVFPLEESGALTATIVGNARLSDLVAASIATLAGTFLLATLTVRRDA